MKKKYGDVCDMYLNVCNEKLVEKIYLERAHWAQATPGLSNTVAKYSDIEMK